MAPEQAQRGRLTPATDVFALAMITFRMLTGRIYWRSGAQARPAMKEMLMELLMKPLPPASGRALELDGAPVPPGFDAWFDRAASRDPSRRFADAHVAWESLAPVLDPTLARREGLHVDAPSETPDEDAIATVAIADRRERGQGPIEASPVARPSPTPSPLGVVQRTTLRSPTPTPLPELIDAARVERIARSDPKASRAFVIATTVVVLVLIAAVVMAVFRTRG
jgi:serine/threonine-protein kinase